jgi:protoporphyrinogen IX oxidase
VYHDVAPAGYVRAMSAQTYLWIKAIHVFGFVLWIGSMVGLAVLLGAHRRAEATARAALAGAGRGVAMVMDLGATLAIAAGVAMVVSPIGLSPFKQPYFHIKLTVVAVLLVAHVLLRIQVGRARRGREGGPPGWLMPAVLILSAATIWLAVVKPMLRG